MYSLSFNVLAVNQCTRCQSMYSMSINVLAVNLCTQCQSMYSLSINVLAVNQCTRCQSMYSLSINVLDVNQCTRCQSMYSLSINVLAVNQCTRCQSMYSLSINVLTVNQCTRSQSMYSLSSKYSVSVIVLTGSQIIHLWCILVDVARFCHNDYITIERGCMSEMIGQLNLEPLNIRCTNRRLTIFHKVINGHLALPIGNLQPVLHHTRDLNSTQYRAHHSGVSRVGLRGVSKSRKFKWLVNDGASQGCHPLI